MALDRIQTKSSQVLLQLLLLVAATLCELQFYVEPTSQTVLQSGDVAFYCIINDLQTSHDVVWYRSGAEISRGDTMLIQDERLEIEMDEARGTYNLLISDVSLTDDTMYYCQVEDPDTFPTQVLLKSKDVRLEVHHVPEHKYPSCFPLTKDNFQAGEEITLTCQSTRGNPPVTLMWTRKGENLDIRPYDTEIVYRNIDYTFTVGPENHGDIFQCKLTTIAAETVHRSCSLGPLDVRYPPEEVAIEGTTSVEADQEIEVLCSSEANPLPVYSWSFNENMDPSRITYSADNQRITFVTKLYHDGLRIVCNATNDLGTAGGSVTLNVVPALTNPAYGTTPSRTLTPKDGGAPSKPQTDNNSIILKPEVLAIIASTLTLILLVLIILIVITCRCRPQNPKSVTQMPQMIYGQYGPSSVQGWEQGSIYFEPRDRISVRDMPVWQRPAPWHRSVAVQVPWVEEPPYEEIGQNWDEGVTLEI